MRRKWLALAASLLVVALLGSPSGATVPGTPCTVFPASNVWNMDISNLPVDAHSATWLASAAASTTHLHPDFGPPKDYGIPWDVVTNAHPTVPITFQYADESDPGPYPFGSDIHVESGSDHHALMVNTNTCVLYELYGVRLKGKRATAGSGAIFNLASNALRPAGWTSADAAGLPIFPGLVRYDEVYGPNPGIFHALRATVSCTQRSYLWPARHQAGVQNPSCPPMGARLRLRGGFDLSTYSPAAQVVLRAMQHYGMFVADNGSNFFFQGDVNANWPASLIAELKTVPASALRVVDESGCEVTSDSAQFAYGPNCPAP